MPSSIPILLYVPNLVGYARLVLLLLGWMLTFTHPFTALAMFLANFALDNVDGYTARKCNQISTFGAFLDVLLDNATRGILWCLALPYGLGSLFLILEMSVLVVTHQIAKVSPDADWKGKIAKDGKIGSPSTFITRIMANNFRTKQGSFVIVGLNGSPLWFWGQRFLPHSSMLRHPAIGCILLPGRLVAGMVEFWVLANHIRALLEVDAAAAKLL